MARPNMEERPSKLNRSERPVRGTLGKRDRLKVTGQEPGWHYCWVNDHNVPDYEDYGYAFVTHEVTVGNRHINVGTQIGEKVTKDVGNGVVGYLMRIKDEDYGEMQAALDKEVDEKEEAMFANLNSKDDGRYGSVKQKRD